MSHNKWRVEKHQDWNNEWRWLVITHKGRIAKWCTTHTEAITTAQKLAHTVTVQLPADVDTTIKVEGYPALEIKEYIGGTVELTSGKAFISLLPQELEPTALALLAQHHKNQKDTQ